MVVLHASIGPTEPAPASTANPAAMTEVYGAMDWYRARPEPEEEFRGTLRRREVAAGPMARTALQYTLVTATDPLPVYAPEPDRPKPYVGRDVVVRAKLVDLTAEGFGLELWIGSIAPAEGGPGSAGQATSGD